MIKESLRYVAIFCLGCVIGASAWILSATFSPSLRPFCAGRVDIEEPVPIPATLVSDSTDDLLGLACKFSYFNIF